MAEGSVLEEGSIAKNHPRRNINLMQFTDAEYVDESDVPVEEEVFQRPKTPPPKKATRKTNKHELDIKRKKLAIEREKLEIEKEKLEIERERIRLQGENRPNTDKYQSLPFKVKLQPFDPKLDDILTFISEFDAVSGQANWSNDIRLLQLRTLLTGEARHVSSQASTSYDDRKRAVIDRYGKRPHEYFVDLVNVRKADIETYRALMARMIQNLNRCIKDKDPIKCLQEEFFLKALPPAQAQWVRRNKGSASVVEAAEDYRIPTKSDNQKKSNGYNNNKRNDNVQNDKNRTKTDNNRCFKCKAIGHYERDCGKKDKKTGNIASYLVKPLVGQRLICVPGEVNGKQVSVKDTGADMTLIREDLVDSKNILQGQNVTLQTAIGQPFCAKLAVVEIDTSYYRGIAQVGLVPELVAEALLGMDILERTSNAFVVTRAQATRVEDENKSDDDTSESEVEHAVEVTKISEDDEITTGNILSVNIEHITKYQQEEDSLINIRGKAAEYSDEPNAFYYEKNVLMRRWKSKDGRKQGTQVVLPSRLKNAVIKIANDQPMAGHLGIEKTKDRISASFYWPGIFRDITEYCIQCDVCQKTAKRRSSEKNPMISPPVVQEPFRKISMSIIGPLERTKKRK
ncbi:unnamed protein product [Mytilus coruscus]|uniref:CCHC-type domain-containing protein n=1 Tax=Mytilus coruscus TaxID=42192 RepID=A0A6J8AJX3_MYTCO|nr:unnamed protein product [Mytilus coruscus]